MDTSYYFMLVASFLIGVTVHEFGHALATDRCGDDTPRIQGRLTLNPLDHLDLTGSVLFLVSAYLGTPFGWGKPVLFHPHRLRNPRRDTVIIAFAGPVMNLILAGILALIVRNGAFGLTYTSPYFQLMCKGIEINVLLFLFNMIPLPPLDGSKILAGILPDSMSEPYQRSMAQWGIMLFMLLFFFGSHFLSPMVDQLTSILSNTTPVPAIISLL